MFDTKALIDSASQPGNYEIEMPEFFNFGFDVIDARAAEADKTAFIAVDRSAENIVHHSFSDLSKSSNRFANVLLSLGAAKGDSAVVIIPRIPAWYDVMIGCIKTGVVAMPGTNLLTAKDIEYRVNKAGAKLAIVTQEHADKVEAILEKCPTLKTLILIGGERDNWVSFEKTCEDASEELSRDQVEVSRSDDTMLIYFTSGTTSLPKMVPRAHSYAIAHTLTGAFWMGFKEDDVHWTLSDTGWAKAAWGMLFPQWMLGVTNVLYDGDARFDADIHLKLIKKLGVTTFCGPPTVYRLFAQLDLSQYDLSSIRHSLSAGEPLNPEVMKVWKEATGNMVHDGYGQTETINIVANMPGMEIRPGSMGKPVPGVDVQIVDDLGNELPVGEVGNIAVRLTEPHPPGLFDGYFEKDGGRNTRDFHHGYYFTGDTAHKDDDGYIWFAARADDIISSAGYRISPFEVESTLLEHPAIAESAVVGWPDDVRGEVVKAYVVLAAGNEPSDELGKEIQEFVKRETAPYKYPRIVEFKEQLPKTISGKIRRVELREEGK